MNDTTKQPEKNTLEFIGRVPMIRFGTEFEAWEDKRKIEYLKKLASSMNEAARVMQDERNELALTVSSLQQQLLNLEKNLTQVKNIMIKNITDSNESKEQNLGQIMQLQSRVKAQDAVIEQLNKELGR
jgi:putative cell wall-binding protein